MEWPRVRLGDVAQEFISGGTPSTKVEHYWTGDIPWITGADVTDNVVVAGRKWITQKAIEDSATHVVPKGAILLVTRTGVGKVAKAGADIAISQDLTGIVLKEGTNADFVAAAIRQKTRNLLDIQQGAIIKGVLRKDVEKLEIPFPPLSEQRRIVEILDQAERIRCLRTEAASKANRILPALFIKMFGDPRTNPMGWPVKPLGEIGELDRGRSRHRPRNDPALLGGSYPLIQTGDIANSGGRITQYTQTYSELGLGQSKMWPSGTLCITIAANIANTGVLELDACFPDSVVGFVPGADTTTEYVQFLLTQLQRVLEAGATQVAQKNINLKMLRSLVVPVPPIDLQNRFSMHVHKQYACRAAQVLIHEKLDRLFASTTSRAFSGGLTASWRETHRKEMLQEMEQQKTALKKKNYRGIRH